MRSVEYDALVTRERELCRELRKARKVIEESKKALEFYANKENWSNDGDPLELHICCIFDAHFCEDMDDRSEDGNFYGGKLARNTLSNLYRF